MTHIPMTDPCGKLQRSFPPPQTAHRPVQAGRINQDLRMESTFLAVEWRSYANLKCQLTSRSLIRNVQDINISGV